MTDSRNSRRTLQGVVVGASASKTLTVRIERLVRHPKYGKYIRKHSQVHAHDENSEAQQGDIVELMGCRPMSKLKRWRLVRVVRRPDTADLVEAIGEQLPPPAPEAPESSTSSIEEVSS
ncbi:MAG TPA: 30S ribosomal protein S17 [Planctomycetes bacterium]|nr:30S ribosomal protein S17 [Planctomycetota bacterium]HIL36513.1 30S ribosomal protein S17 [Planctomycetota bacterium]